MKRFRVYCAILVGVIVAGILYNSLNEYLLCSVGEYPDLNQVIQRQQATNGLYQGLAWGVGEYKLAMYAQRKPDVVLLGTSRALRSHQEYYSSSFYTMGGAVYGTATARAVVDRLLKIHRPKLVVYNLDYFYFCTHYKWRASAQAQSDYKPGMPPTGWGWQKINRFTVIPNLAAEKRISLTSLARVGLGMQSVDDWFFGLGAVDGTGGIRVDGSLAVAKEVPSTQHGFEHESDQIASGEGFGYYFERGCLYDRVSMLQVHELQDFLRAQGIPMVVIVAPLPPSIFKAFMKAPDEVGGYIQNLRSDLAKADLDEEHFNLDGAALGATDDEFLDLIHAGDVAEARSVLAAASAPHSLLAQFIDRSALQLIIDRYAGRSQISFGELRALPQAQANTDDATRTKGR